MGAPLLCGSGRAGSLKVEKDSTGVSGRSRQREQQMLRVRGNHTQVTKDQVWFLETTEDPTVWTDHNLFF